MVGSIVGSNMAATDARFLSSNFGNSFSINTRIYRFHDRSQIVIPRAQSSSSPSPSPPSDKNKTKSRPGTTTTKESEETAAKKLDVAPPPTAQSPSPPTLKLDDVNPVGLGRRSRQIFDEVWRKFSGLGQMSRTTRPDEQETLDSLLIREGPMCEFAVPGAQNVTVLVVGATSRIGRIVVRKLMLRGYTVKVRLHSKMLIYNCHKSQDEYNIKYWCILCQRFRVFKY